MATAQQPTGTPGGGTRIFGAVVGMFVFLGGVALLAYVFYSAAQLFSTAPPEVPPTPPPGTDPKDTTGSAITTLSTSLVDYIKRLLTLLLMCVAGSVIASRGADMFFKSCTATPSKP